MWLCVNIIMNLHLGDELTFVMSAWQPTSLLVFDPSGVIRCSFALSGQQSPVVIVPWVVFVTSRPRSCRSLWASFSNPISFCLLETCSFSSGGRFLHPGPFFRWDASTVWVEWREGLHVMLLKIGRNTFAFCVWLLPSDCWAVVSSEPGCRVSQGHGLFIALCNTGPDFLLWL